MKQPIFSIVKPDLEHMEEVLEDIRLQLEQGIATMPLFYLAMVPEGTPPANKAAAFAAEFLPIRCQKMISPTAKRSVASQISRLFRGLRCSGADQSFE